MAERQLEEYQSNLISSALSTGALKFGDGFVLKSGRVSPYFFLITEMNTGRLIDDLASAYAKYIAASLAAAADDSEGGGGGGGIPRFDVIFGPAYKGIPLAAAVALLLWRDHRIDVAWAYDRKEAKDHGEGGVLVGAPVAEKRVLILDDVVTAGTAIRAAVRNITAARGRVVGVVVCLDREEVGATATAAADNGGDADSARPRASTMQEVASEIDGPVRALVGMRDLMAWLRSQGRTDDLRRMEAYWQKYGISSPVN